MHRVRAALLVPAMAFFGSAVALPVMSAATMAPAAAAPVAFCIENPAVLGGGCVQFCPKGFVCPESATGSAVAAKL